MTGDEPQPSGWDANIGGPPSSAADRRRQEADAFNAAFFPPPPCPHCGEHGEACPYCRPRPDDDDPPPRLYRVTLDVWTDADGIDAEDIDAAVYSLPYVVALGDQTIIEKINNGNEDRP